jgi:putative peptidoglycan lipid II flippase
VFVALGILASRVMGFVRERVFAHYFGNSVPAAAFKAALRIPTFVQTLFGEGVLSGSFIPIYASLLGKDAKDEADHVASAVFGLISTVVSISVAIGMLFAEPLTDIITPGFKGESHALAVSLVRIAFPGTGLLVLCAWCLGVLNSHRRFFLSYAAPVIWNSTIIAALVIFSGATRDDLPRLAEYAMYGNVAGSLLQLLVQFPAALTLMGRFRFVLSARSESVRIVLRNFAPVVVGRGVAQVSAFIATAFASLIGSGQAGVGERALSAMNYAQTLYLLPVSLFGMSVSAAELTEMSRVSGAEVSQAVIAEKLRARITTGLERIAFFVVPSSIAFFFLGDIIGAALFETGRFTPKESRYLWYLLMGGAMGLLASTAGRLYSSGFYALKDTRTPLMFAIIRLLLTAFLGWWASLYLPEQLGLPPSLGAVGLLATGGLAAWAECALLRIWLERRIGRARLSARRALALYAAATASAAAAIGAKIALVAMLGTRGDPREEWGGMFLPAPALHPVLVAAVILLVYGSLYFAITVMLGVPQASSVLTQAARRLGLRK